MTTYPYSTIVQRAKQEEILSGRGERRKGRREGERERGKKEERKEGRKRKNKSKNSNPALYLYQYSFISFNQYGFLEIAEKMRHQLYCAFNSENMQCEAAVSSSSSHVLSIFFTSVLLPNLLCYLDMDYAYKECCKAANADQYCVSLLLLVHPRGQQHRWT